MKKQMTIVLDAGHGQVEKDRYDPGAVEGTMKESLLTLDFCQRLAARLQDGFSRFSWNVIQTRPHDGVKASLGDRAQLANESNADLFISIHFNAAENKSAHGFEVWTSVGQSKSDAVAENIFQAISQDPLTKATMRSDFSDGDHDKESNFYVLRKTSCPAVLIELAFITNKDEMISFLARRDAFVNAIVFSIERSF